MSNQILISADHLGMALQAVTTGTPVSRSVLNAIITTFSAASKSIDAISEELDCMLTTLTAGGANSSTQTPTTPAHQALNGLSNDGLSIPELITQKVIDAITAIDAEVVLLSSMNLSNAACTLSGGATALDDIGRLLDLIHSEKVEASTTIALARLAQEATNTWADLLNAQATELNEPLSRTRFGKEIAR